MIKNRERFSFYKLESFCTKMVILVTLTGQKSRISGKAFGETVAILQYTNKAPIYGNYTGADLHYAWQPCNDKQVLGHQPRKDFCAMEVFNLR